VNASVSQLQDMIRDAALSFGKVVDEPKAASSVGPQLRSAERKSIKLAIIASHRLQYRLHAASTLIPDEQEPLA
jgi:hypothetical protein